MAVDVVAMTDLDAIRAELEQNDAEQERLIRRRGELIRALLAELRRLREGEK